MNDEIDINLTGEIHSVDFDEGKVCYVAVAQVGEFEVPSVKVVLTGLPQSTLRAIASRYERFPLSIRFG